MLEISHVSLPKMKRFEEPPILTLAISSLFLNSPFTRVTFPVLSNSVHRRRGSLDAFATNPRPILKLPSVPSLISAGGWRRYDLDSAALFRLKSKSLRHKLLLLVDDARVDCALGRKNGLGEER